MEAFAPDGSGDFVTDFDPPPSYSIFVRKKELGGKVPVFPLHTTSLAAVGSRE